MDTHRDNQSCEDLWFSTSVDTEINEHMQERCRFLSCWLKVLQSFIKSKLSFMLLGKQSKESMSGCGGGRGVLKSLKAEEELV